MDIITIDHITKDFGNKRGVFDLSFTVKQGEVFGFLGPNGAGKTTTIRNLMGFTKPDHGSCSIQIGGKKLDCFQQSAQIQTSLGYLPGEIAFPDEMHGDQLLNFLADMKGLRDRTRMKELTERFELNPTGIVKRMSKGMKQKIGIINAFMTSPEVLILDEPTSGLDPLMQNRFVELILEEKKRGATILMSSHMFEEIERTCDRTAIISAGKLVAVETLSELSQKKNKKYKITFDSENAVREMLTSTQFSVLDSDQYSITFSIANNLSPFLQELTKYPIADMSVESPSLEELFMHFYQTNPEDN